MTPLHPLTRRRFLQVFAFSAAASALGCTNATIPETGSPEDVISHLLMVGDWGYDTTTADQSQVAAAMIAYVTQNNITTGALLMLGDNFYGELTGGVASTRWQSQFEAMYPQSTFNCPAYAVPGNHDYQMAPQSKFDAELAYAQTGTSRWTMPSRYYTFSFPAANPLITFFALDTNMPNEPAQPPPPDPSFYTQTADQEAEQLAWFTAALQQPITTPFIAVMGHHPIYTDGSHGDNQTLINTIDPLLRQYGVHLHLAGHDHDLQHLEFAGHPTSFITSGGGGATVVPLASTSSGPFAEEIHGFSHLMVQKNLLTFRHLDSQGNLLHAFTKTPSGTVTILT